jgi:hypothetical protein
VTGNRPAISPDRPPSPRRNLRRGRRPGDIRSGFVTSGAAWRWINKHERRALYPLRVQGVPRAERERQAREMIELVRLGARHGAAALLIIDVLFGLQRTALGLTIEPRLPPHAEGLSFTLSLPRDGLSIELEVLANGAVCGYSRGQDSGGRFEAAFGDMVILRPARSS